MMKIVRTSLYLLIAALTSVSGHTLVHSSARPGMCAGANDLAIGMLVMLVPCSQAMMWNTELGIETAIEGEINQKICWDVNSDSYVTASVCGDDRSWYIKGNSIEYIQNTDNPGCVTVDGNYMMIVECKPSDVTQQFYP